MPEALHRLTECYTALGLTDEAERVASVLGYNYPGSDWYGNSYALLKTDAPTAFAKGVAEDKAAATPAGVKSADQSQSPGFFGRMVGVVTSLF